MSEIPPQLRWACRRGMLELDVLLGNYLNEVYPKADSREQALFVKLLDQSDQDLFEWLTDKKQATDPEIEIMVKKIREHARTRARS